MHEADKVAPLTSTSTSSTSTSAEIVAAVEASVSCIPGLRIYARDHCLGNDWMINPARREIHVNGELDVAEFTYACAEALEALRLHLDNVAADDTPDDEQDELAQRRASSHRS